MSSSPFPETEAPIPGAADRAAGSTAGPALAAGPFPAADMPFPAGDPRAGESRNLDSILRIPVLVQVVLGSATMPVANLMKLGRGAVVPLDHRIGEPVDVMVNGRVIARGEIVIVEEDNSRFGVSLTEVVGPAGSDAGG